MFLSARQGEFTGNLNIAFASDTSRLFPSRVGKYISSPSEGSDLNNIIKTSITPDLWPVQYTPWILDNKDGQARIFKGKDFLSYINIDFLAVFNNPDQLQYAQESRLGPLYVYYPNGELVGLIMPINVRPEKTREHVKLLTA